MLRINFKTAIVLVFSFFILTACQQVSQILTNVSEAVSGKVKLEQKKQADKAIANLKCQELCQNILFEGDLDFTTGPCLSNQIIPDWVCDIAHVPRQAVDNDPANQCAAFRKGEARHYVELDGNCNVINVK